MTRKRVNHRTLVRFALSFAHVFAWVAAFQHFFAREGNLGAALAALALTYALTQVLVVLLTPLAAQRIRNGTRVLMVCAIGAAAAAFTALSVSFSGMFWTPDAGIFFFALLMGVYRALYFVPYELTGAVAYPLRAEVLIACAPFAAGVFLLAPNALPALFIIAAVILAVSLIPLARVPEFPEGFSWGYAETFRRLFAEGHGRMLAASVCEGIEGAALLLLWPTVAFVILGGSFPLLGVVLMLTFVFGIALRMLFVSVPRMRESAPVAVIAVVSAWVLRLSVASGIAIVLVDAYYRATGFPARRGIDAASHEQSSDSGTYVDEYTALKEIGMGIGRLLFVIGLAILASSFSFAVAAAAGLLSAAAAAAGAILVRPAKKAAIA